jgi:hypothetical protein
MFMEFDPCITCSFTADCERDVEIAAIFISAFTRMGEKSYHFGETPEESFGHPDDLEAIQDIRSYAKFKQHQRDCLLSDSDIDILVDAVVEEFNNEIPGT